MVGSAKSPGHAEFHALCSPSIFPRKEHPCDRDGSFDLRLKFQLAEARYDGFTVVVILNVGGRVVGAVVDSVSDVVDLAPSQIRPAPEVGSDPEGNFVAGLGTIASGEQQRMLVLIDIERLMAATELARFTAVA